MQLDRVIKTRKSVRHYSDAKPNWRKILRALDSVRFAPAAGNQFVLKFILVKDKSKCTIAWGTGSRAQTTTGNINKVGITETAGLIGASKTNYESEKNFAVQLSLIVGTDK